MLNYQLIHFIMYFKKNQKCYIYIQNLLEKEAVKFLMTENALQKVKIEENKKDSFTLLRENQLMQNQIARLRDQNSRLKREPAVQFSHLEMENLRLKKIISELKQQFDVLKLKLIESEKKTLKVTQFLEKCSLSILPRIAQVENLLANIQSVINPEETTSPHKCRCQCQQLLSPSTKIQNETYGIKKQDGLSRKLTLQRIMKNDFQRERVYTPRQKVTSLQGSHTIQVSRQRNFITQNLYNWSKLAGRDKILSLELFQAAMTESKPYY